MEKINMRCGGITMKKCWALILLLPLVGCRGIFWPFGPDIYFHDIVIRNVCANPLRITSIFDSENSYVMSERLNPGELGLVERMVTSAETISEINLQNYFPNKFVLVISDNERQAVLDKDQFIQAFQQAEHISPRRYIISDPSLCP